MTSFILVVIFGIVFWILLLIPLLMSVDISELELQSFFDKNITEIKIGEAVILFTLYLLLVRK